LITGAEKMHFCQKIFNRFPWIFVLQWSLKLMSTEFLDTSDEETLLYATADRYLNSLSKEEQARWESEEICGESDRDFDLKCTIFNYVRGSSYADPGLLLALLLKLPKASRESDPEWKIWSGNLY
jgi:hypothetical protein